MSLSVSKLERRNTMNKRLEPLFTPWNIGDVKIKNRIVMTSMGGTSIFGWMEKNHFDIEASKFLLTVAKNNVGLILPGIQPIYNPMFGQWLYKNKGMYKKLKKFMEEVHKTGAKMFVQLTAGFGRSFAINEMMEKLYSNKVLNVLSKPVMNLDKITASCSPLPNRWSDKVPSRELKAEEIEDYIKAFGKTAVLLKEAGVDGVEVHAVHEGYLIDQFTTKYTNHRKDAYGGSFENRYRFPAEIVKEIKKQCGKSFPVSLRFSVVSKTKGFRQGAVPGEEYTEVGRDLSEAILAAKYLSQCGYDMFNCDNGTYDAWYYAHPPIYMNENCNIEEVEQLRKAIDTPVVCAGRMDPFFAADKIKEKSIDAVGIARPFLADPMWVSKLIAGKEKDIRPCICCHNGCFNMAHYNGVANDQDLSDALHMARCAVNPETMQSDKHYIKLAEKNKVKKVAIIGGGIGGMEAARVLKLRGHIPVIYEKSDHLGGVFKEAGNASFKGKLRELLLWYLNEMKKMKIEIHLNREVKDLNDIDADYYIVATGSKPILPPVLGNERGMDALDYLKGREVKEKVAIIGGGLTGCEIAYELVLEGKKPFIVEMKNDLIAQKGVCLANSSYLREYLAFKNVPVYLNTTLKRVYDGKIECTNKDGDSFFFDCDNVIYAIGYKKAPLMSDKKNVFYVGDCQSVGNLRTVTWSAYEAAMKI